MSAWPKIKDLKKYIYDLRNLQTNFLPQFSQFQQFGGAAPPQGVASPGPALPPPPTNSGPFTPEYAAAILAQIQKQQQQQQTVADNAQGWRIDKINIFEIFQF